MRVNDTTTTTMDCDPESTLDRLPTFLTVDELAKLLRVNHNTAYEAIHRGEIPGVNRIGRKIRICRVTVVR